MAVAICACHEKKEDVCISLDSFAGLRNPAYVIDKERIDDNIHHLVMSDTGRGTADIHARRHYLDGGRLVWITRQGVSAKADSVLEYVSRAGSFGFSPDKFFYSVIKDDLHRARNLDFGTGRNDINHVYARLEFYLTKAFLRYAEGQRFGYVDPYGALNRLDVRDSDSVRVTYRQLYDVHTRRPDKDFAARAFEAMGGGDAAVGRFLAASRPANPLYYTLLRHLNEPGVSPQQRQRILVNMERCRWNVGDYPHMHKKYVLVNIPSLHLMAVDGADTMTMRIGLGSLETKTPLLTSRVKRMDFNPQWVIPKSIVKTSVRHHAGSRGYFDSHNYFIQQRSTGKEVSPENVTGDMLMSPDYLVIQRGGIGNALGRVIFRFDNDFSIFMHDTSNPGVFSRADRSVSHGCIRVERPFDLAVFMLADKDDGLIDRMRYSMTVRYAPKASGADADDEDGEEPIDRKRMVRSVPVEPQVPIFITYYTLYPGTGGRLVAYGDIYGFDTVIYSKLEPLL